MSTAVDNLGARLDGWADLIDGASTNVEETAKHFFEIIQSHQLPDVEIKRQTLTTGGISGKERSYYINSHKAGVTLAVYIGAAGKDLYITWDAYIRPIVNKQTLFIIGGISAFLGLISASSRDPWTGQSSFSLLSYLIAAIGWAVFIALLTAGAGKVLKNNPLTFFFEQIDTFIADDITAMMLAVHHSIVEALDAMGIKKSILRTKDQFYAGRRDRLI